MLTKLVILQPININKHQLKAIFFRLHTVLVTVTEL